MQKNTQWQVDCQGFTGRSEQLFIKDQSLSLKLSFDETAWFKMTEKVLTVGKIWENTCIVLCMYSI